MELESLVKEVKAGLETFKTNANNDIQTQKSAMETLKEQVEQLGKLDGVAKAADLEQIRKDFDELATKFNEGEFKQKERVTFKKSFSDAIDTIKNDLKGAVNKKGLDKSIELKDMDFDNFSTEAVDILTTETRPGIYSNPWSQLWLRNIFPNASTSSSTIKYVQEDEDANADAGAADIWDGSATIEELLAKPDVAYNFNDASADVYWIAGIVRLKREMLDDMPFLRTYIPQQLIYGKRGIFIRENTLILATMNTNSVAYNGSKTILIEQIIDGIAQLKDNYHAGTHILMNHRDANEILFNKATGSGEYDLPSNVVQISNTGELIIKGLPVIGLPQFESGTAFVLDARSSMFVNRMSPEVRFFEEDRDNVIKNLITIRAEERATQLVFDPTSIVKIDQGT